MVQSLPKDAKPVIHWPHPDQAFFEIAKAIHQAAHNTKAKAAAKALTLAKAERKAQAEAKRRTAEKAEAERLAKTVAILPPPFAWVKIPTGQVTLIEEYDESTYLPKGKATVFKVKPFFIAKYPLTNAQFKLFVEAGGYEEKQWWTKVGWEARQQGWDWDSNRKTWKPTGNPWTQPRYWNDEKWNGDEQPVVGISWYEAVAYCLWLSDKTGRKIMLPTEAQWQYAAQGRNRRNYPWGNGWDGSRCRNSVGARWGSAGSSTPVTQYEGKGDSPFGVVDMAGNVWEWCLTDYEKGTNDMNSQAGKRVLRGGSWDYGNADFFRASYRDGIVPDLGDYDGGMRLALSL